MGNFSQETSSRTAAWAVTAGRLCRTTFPDAFVRELRPAAIPTLKWSDDVTGPVVRTVGSGERVVFLVSDQTRKTGLAALLPGFLRLWRQHGLRLEQLTFLVACGSHRGPTPAELARVFGPEVWSDCRDSVQIHNAFSSPCRRLGTTRRGTPVELSELAVRADAVISCGAVVLHYFAGFSGGPKSVLPGIASARTIAANHRLSLDPGRAGFARGVAPGRIDGNPVAEDIAEGAAFLPVRATIQTVVGPDGRLAAVFAGCPETAVAPARATAARLFLRPLSTPADVVVASAGAAPNWVQAHKALVNACRAVAPEGTVVLDAPCPEGLGSDSIRRWLEKGTPQAIVRGLAECADINGQTALSTLLRGRRTILVTRMSAEQVRLTGMERVEDLAAGVGLARDRMQGAGRSNPRILLMPQAGLTVPSLTGT